ncbi:MAG: sulfate transporter CysZ [Pseudomonadales bacterium]|nr:sulfate transporter CysZ [Pseudomonadales bacterium]
MNGIQCLVSGFKLVRAPGLREYVIVPLLINMVMLSIFAAYGYSHYQQWMVYLTGWLPDWLQFLAWIVQMVASVAIFVLTIYSFSVVANIIASPFNAVLSDRIEVQLRGEQTRVPVSLMLTLGRAVSREVLKLLYYLPRLLGLIVLSLVPGVNVIAPLAWLLFGAWMMAIQYTDYAADNNALEFERLRQRLRANLFQSLLFGMAVYFLIAIPLLNLLLIPVAVAGGTVFWVEWLTKAGTTATLNTNSKA